MACDEQARTGGRSRRSGRPSRAHRVSNSLSQLESDISRQQARWREVRAKHAREARRDLDEQDGSAPAASRVIDFDEARPFEIVTHPFQIPEEAARG